MKKLIAERDLVVRCFDTYINSYLLNEVTDKDFSDVCNLTFRCLKSRGYSELSTEDFIDKRINFLNMDGKYHEMFHLIINEYVKVFL